MTLLSLAVKPSALLGVVRILHEHAAYDTVCEHRTSKQHLSFTHRSIQSTAAWSNVVRN